MLNYQPCWWLTYPSEKYEFVSWDDEILNIWKNKCHVPNHQPVYNEKPAANPMGLRCLHSARHLFLLHQKMGTGGCDGTSSILQATETIHGHPKGLPWLDARLVTLLVIGIAGMKNELVPWVLHQETTEILELICLSSVGATNYPCF